MIAFVNKGDQEAPGSRVKWCLDHRISQSPGHGELPCEFLGKVGVWCPGFPKTAYTIEPYLVVHLWDKEMFPRSCGREYRKCGVCV